MSQFPRSRALEVYNAQDPDSVVNRLPANSKLREMVELIPDEMKHMNEKELFAIVQPSQNIQMIRHSFWAEVRFADEMDRPINIENCFAGIMTKTSFAKNLTPHVAAFILCQTQEYHVKLEHAHELAMEGIVEILNVPRSGNPAKDYNYDRLKIEIFKFLNDKKHGAAVQKQLTLTHNIAAKKDDTATVDEIKKQFESGGIIEVDT